MLIKLIAGLPEMVSKPECEWQWSKLPKKPYKEGATPAEITASSIDSSYTLQTLLDMANRYALSLCGAVFHKNIQLINIVRFFLKYLKI